MRHMQMHFISIAICIPVPVSNQHLYVRVVLLNIHTTFVIQHGPKYDMMHKDSVTTTTNHLHNMVLFVILLVIIKQVRHSSLFNIIQHGYYFIIQPFTT